jgi:hypothetical protein
MSDLINKLKSIKNATKIEVDKVIDNYSYEQVVKDLKEAGIDRNDLSDIEFKQLLAEEVEKSRKFSKGLLVGGGAIMLLELLG